MRTWGYTPSTDEVAVVTNAMAAFRETWASIRPPWPAAFDGTATDVRAIDYLEYEGLSFPPCGAEGAALVCGEVIRRAGGLEWVIAYTGEWFLSSAEDDWPAITVYPVARVQELNFAGTPQFGRYSRFVSNVAMDCLPYAAPERIAGLRKLADLDDSCIQRLSQLIGLLRFGR